MATQILDWDIDEGSGTTLVEDLNSLDAYFSSAGGYPQWVAGPTGVAGTALRFSGSTNSGAYAATDSPIACDYSAPFAVGNNPDDPLVAYPPGITIRVQFRRGGTTRGGGLLGGYYILPANYPSAGSPASFANLYTKLTSLWIDNSGTGYIRFGHLGSTTASAYWISFSIPAPADTDWHTLVVKYLSFHTCEFNLDNVETIVSPGVRGPSCSTSTSGIFNPSGTFYNDFWFIGRCDTYVNSYQYHCGYNQQSFYGDIARADVWCGQLSDSEIAELFINSGVGDAAGTGTALGVGSYTGSGGLVGVPSIPSKRISLKYYPMPVRQNLTEFRLPQYATNEFYRIQSALEAHEATTVNYGKEYVNVASGATTKLSWRNRQKQSVLLEVADTTLVFEEPLGCCNVMLRLIQDDVGGRTFTLPSEMHWQGGTEPTWSTGAGMVDVVAAYYDGQYYHATASLDSK